VIVSFTGHRPKKFSGYKPCPTHDWVRARVREKLIELKPTEAISGMALGFDQWSAEVCIELGIPFVAAIPFVGQELEWPWYSQQHYLTLLKKAARVHVVDSVPPTAYYEAAQKLLARNHWMVDNSDAVIAAWDGSDGGTEKCVKYAQKVGRPIHLINGWPV
jgi:uncharacterized phage-like protein YoqJ